MQGHAMFTRTELAQRWNVSLPTINKWIAEKKIKPNKITNMFPLDYVEALERQDIDLDTVSAFKLRALERENKRLRAENAMLKSTLLQVTMIATEGARNIFETSI